MEQIDNILSSLTKSIDQSIKDLSKCKDLAQRKSHAEIIKLLCESMGVFFNAMNNYDPYEFDDDYDLYDDYDDYDDKEEVYDIKKARKSKKGKKKDDDVIPF